MSIYLVQHGRAIGEGADSERRLTDEGMAEVERISGVAGGYGIKPSSIRHSGKRRAMETAEIFARGLHVSVMEPVDGINPGDDVAAFADRISNDGTMYVGHLPFMERLASYLVTGSHAGPVFKFQNGGIVCLDIDPGSGAWVIKWALMPVIE
ncbi:MAG: phosphohistidine phosphatase SixA [Spirochaetes bacterium]|jgi:phosphohistidine phosphatase|nr:phosphohistidine phosphatase SixA [Spirochaetota bacterium]